MNEPNCSQPKCLAAVLIILVAMVLLLGCGSEFLNQTPIISSLTANEELVNPLGNCRVTCVARDPDRDELTYTWSASGGTISGDGPTVTWVAPETSGVRTITVTVADGRGGEETMEVTVDVLAENNLPPFIKTLTAKPRELYDDETSTLTCVAIDLDGDELSYTWEATGGTISGEGPIVIWTPPDVPGVNEEHTVTVRATDSKGNRSARRFLVFDVICSCLKENAPGD